MEEGSGIDRPPVSVGEDVFEVVEDALYDLWSVANELARIRPSRPRYFRVTIFGSSRIRPGDPIYEEVRTLARRLAEMGCDIVTGGGPGLMQAANEGARLGDPDNVTRSFGLPIEIPLREEEPNPFVEKIYHHRTFFSRLHHFVRLSSAFIVVPGGIGTMLETALVWQLLQVRHVVDGVPLILIGRMWEDLVGWSKRHMLRDETNLASSQDLEIPFCVRNAHQACDIIQKRLDVFNRGAAEAP